MQNHAKYETLVITHLKTYHTGCPKKHGNSVTNSISSLL